MRICEYDLVFGRSLETYLADARMTFGELHLSLFFFHLCSLQVLDPVRASGNCLLCFTFLSPPVTDPHPTLLQVEIRVCIFLLFSSVALFKACR